MSSPSSAAGEPAEFKPFTKTEHINQLNDIDKSITQLLQSAGQALKILSSSQNSEGAAIADRRQTFQTAADAYIRTLQSVDINVKRQIYALEEANIIPAEVKKKVAPQEDMSTSMMSFPAGGGAKKAQAPKPPAETIADGSMGKLDIGWLNTRSGRVGRDMEAELWEKSRIFLEAIGGGSDGLEGALDKDTEMTT